MTEDKIIESTEEASMELELEVDERSRKDADGKFTKRPAKFKKKVCKFCTDKQMEAGLDYKNVELLERFVSNRGKIVPRRITGTCAKHQRVLAREIRKSRSIGLLPYKVF